MPISAAGDGAARGGEGADTTGGEGADTAGGERAANSDARRASTRSAQARAMSAGGTRAPNRPPGARAGWRGPTSGGTPNVYTGACGWRLGTTIVRASATI